MAQIQEINLNPPPQGSGATIILAAATVSRLQVLANMVAVSPYLLVSCDAAVAMCRGDVATNPVAGVDQLLLANTQYRVGPLVPGEYLCFISTPGGNLQWNRSY